MSSTFFGKMSGYIALFGIFSYEKGREQGREGLEHGKLPRLYIIRCTRTPPDASDTPYYI
jgi:hypothetical protein